MDFSKRKEEAMRGHLDRVAASLSAARSAGSAAGAQQGGLGYGAAWPAPIAGAVAHTATLKRTKAVVRNAERPQTPVQEPPGDDDELHRAAVLLQQLIRGRAIQSDMYAAAEFRRELIRELMTPLAAPVGAGGTEVGQHPEAAATDAAVAADVRRMLQCVLFQSQPGRLHVRVPVSYPGSLFAPLQSSGCDGC